MDNKKCYVSPDFEVVILEDGNLLANQPDNGGADMKSQGTCWACDMSGPAQI